MVKKIQDIHNIQTLFQDILLSKKDVTDCLQTIQDITKLSIKEKDISFFENKTVKKIRLHVSNIERFYLYMYTEKLKQAFKDKGFILEL